MNLTRDRAQSIGWAVVFTLCLALTVALTFRVNAVKSRVQLTEREIVALKRDKLYLETEFQTRANQQQLTALNDVQFGYVAPIAAQYVEGERQLAALGEPRAADAPAPILVASADGSAKSGTFPAIVTPLAVAGMAHGPATHLLRHNVEPVAAQAGAFAEAAVRIAAAQPARPAVARESGRTKAEPARVADAREAIPATSSAPHKIKAAPSRLAVAGVATTAKTPSRAQPKAEPARLALTGATTTARAASRAQPKVKAEPARVAVARAAAPAKAAPARLAVARVATPAKAARASVTAAPARLAAARVPAPAKAPARTLAKATRTGFDIAFADRLTRIRSPKVEEQ